VDLVNYAIHLPMSHMYGLGNPLLLVHGFALVGHYEAASRYCSTTR
jgi:hypothetical protein